MPVPLPLLRGSRTPKAARCFASRNRGCGTEQRGHVRPAETVYLPARHVCLDKQFSVAVFKKNLGIRASGAVGLFDSASGGPSVGSFPLDAYDFVGKKLR